MVSHENEPNSYITVKPEFGKSLDGCSYTFQQPVSHLIVTNLGIKHQKQEDSNKCEEMKVNVSVEVEIKDHSNLEV